MGPFRCRSMPVLCRATDVLLRPHLDDSGSHWVLDRVFRIGIVRGNFGRSLGTLFAFNARYMKRYSLLLFLARRALAVPFKSLITTYVSNDKPSLPHDDTPEVGSPEFWYKMGISVGLVLLGGVFAG